MIKCSTILEHFEEEKSDMSLIKNIRDLFNSNHSSEKLVFEPLLKSLLSMAWFVEARDPYTGGHLWRVSQFSYLLAKKSGLSEAMAAQISLGGFLHDLGKIGISDSILRKTERLTDEEYNVIKTHPEVGFRLISDHPLAEVIKDAVLSHHERPDGKGYPHGLNSESLSPMAKIVGICDAFDAMTSSRPYRKGMTEEKALSILLSEKDAQFDGSLVDAMQMLSIDGKLKHIIGHTDEGIPLHNCPMCGPTLVVKKDHQVGDQISCNSCHAEFGLAVDGQGIMVPTPTGKNVSAAQRGVDLDEHVIESTLILMRKNLSQGVLKPLLS
ncbi:HD-GYP domain-containing protein [Marinomonas sp.]